MTLASYMKEHDLTDAAFARLIKVDRSVVTKLRSGKITPSIRTASRIINATNGAVSLDSLIPADRAA